MIAHAIQGRNIERNGTVLQLSTLTTPLVYPCADGEVVPDRHDGDARRPRSRGWSRTGTVTRGVGRRRGLDDLRGAHAHRRRRSRTRSTEVRERDHAPSRCQVPQGGAVRAAASPRGVTLAPVNTVADVLALEHLAVRDYWHDATRSRAAATLRAPGPFVKALAHAGGVAPPGAGVGEHTREVLDARAERRRGTGARRAEPSRRLRRLPFEGVKVADFSWIGVGPITAKYLADHGATVVHVETEQPGRPAAPRRARSRTTSPGINRCQFFGSFNTSKLSLAAQPEAPRGPRGRQAPARLGATSASTRSPPAPWPSSASATTWRASSTRASSWRAPA